MTLRLDGRVAIVTGGGAGLGRAHALLLATQGAKVVVNDLQRPDGKSSAEDVVAEIRQAGGEAIVAHGSVAEEAFAGSMVRQAVETFGRIDILVNNAGILRDKSFAKMAPADFDLVLQVHLMGSLYCTRAAWPLMLAQKYGRIVFTTSVAGLAGGFGQSNYGTAKMGMLGLMNTLGLEGAKHNVFANAIMPAATTGMTAGIVAEQMAKLLKAELVSPAVAWLASERCTQSGLIISGGGGGFGRVQLVETRGVQFDPAEVVSVDVFDAALAEITDMSTATPLQMGTYGRLDERLKSRGLL